MIGNQCWFSKNLNIGTRINGNRNQSDADAGSFDKFCYGDSESNCTTYGGLYEWHTAMAFDSQCDNKKYESPCIPSNPHQGICPSGWHVPSEYDFNKLINTTGGVDLAGGRLKDFGTTYWNIPNVGGSDTYGFSALGSGYLIRNKSTNLNSATFYWTSTYHNRKRAKAMFLTYQSDDANVRTNHKESGSSVRCVYDQETITYQSTYTLTYSAGTNGSVSGTTTQIVSYGGNGTSVTATPDSDYLFMGWDDGVSDNPRVDTAVFSDKDVTAIFAYDGVDNTPPTAPGALTLNSAGFYSATLNLGSQSSDSYFSDYVIYYKIGSSGVDDTDASFTSATIPALGSVNYGGNSTVTLPNLVPNTQYNVNIWAYDESGNSKAASSTLTFSTSGDTTPPTAPGALAAVYTGQGIAGLKVGSASTDTFFQHYKVYLKQGASGVTESDTEINQTSEPILGYSDFNGNVAFNVDTLSPNTQYTANIWAYDYYGNKSSSPTEVTFTTQNTDIVKSTRDNINYTLIDSDLALPVNGYGGSTESASRVQLQKSIAYTNSSSISDSVAVVIPSGTIMTTKSVGDVETTTDFSTMSLTDNPNVSTLPVPAAGKMSFGFDDKKVELSNAITLTMATPGVEDGTELMVYSKDASQGNWTRLTLDNENVNCTVSSQRCSFQTKHLSEFGGGDPDVPVGGVPEFSTYVYTLLFLLFGYMLHQKMPEYLGEPHT